MAMSTEVGVVLPYLVLSLITLSPLKVRETTPVPFFRISLAGTSFSPQHISVV